MAKIKYYYDTESCKYVRVKTTKGDIFLNILGIGSLTMAMAVGLLLTYTLMMTPMGMVAPKVPRPAPS